MPKANIHEASSQLRCTLCPKSPQFSDVSHLLTHISSKSHLAHKFKLQIKAQSTPSAKQQLDDFDIWYHNNNLDHLLSERLAAKEQKKNTRTRRQPKPKAENLGKGELEPADSDRQSTLTATPMFRAPVPRMHLWPTTSTPSSEWGPPPIYETPTTRRQLPNFDLQQTPVNTMPGDMVDPNLVTPWKPDPEEDEKREEKIIGSATKLKGIFWPGMDLFDSATPEMKRKRNQRKDGSILEQMINTSTVTEPLEYVYSTLPTGDFELERTRDIFGPPSIENSPAPEVKAPTPKKRKRRSPRKATFQDLAVNAPRMRGTRSKKAISAGSPVKRQRQPPQQQPSQKQALPQYNNEYERLTYQPVPTLNPLAAFGNQYMPTKEEEEEFRLTTLTFGDTTKKSFDIFQDAPEISPSRTESPLEEARFDFPSHGLPIYNNTSSTQMSPTPVVKPAPIRIYGKENGLPEMQPQFRAQRTVPTAHGYPPQVFSMYDPSFNPLYNPLNNAYAHQFGYSYPSYNQDFKPAAALNSGFEGDFKPFPSIPRGQSQQSFGSGSGSSNNGNGMHFGI